MEVYGVIGWPIKHSLSPCMHNAAFKELGLEAEYRLFEVKPEALEDFLLNRNDVRGFNITVPHKVRAKEILEKNFPPDTDKGLPDYVKLSDAVNTVKRQNGKSLYLNTDVMGFRRSLSEDLNFVVKDKDVFLIGCGGAGRAVISGLAGEGNSARRIYIYEKSEKVARSAQEHFLQYPALRGRLEFIIEKDIQRSLRNCRLLVNASPVGMKEGDAAVIGKELLHKDLFVYDVVYNRETELIRNARSLGLPVSGGLGMLLYQGAHAFEFWTGRKAPIEVMKQALSKTLT